MMVISDTNGGDLQYGDLHYSAMQWWSARQIIVICNTNDSDLQLMIVICNTNDGDLQYKW